jgi:hypothetical protein
MKNTDQRSYPRITTFLPFQVHRLVLQDYEDVECRVSLGDIIIEESPTPPVEDERLARWLVMVNAKLDYLIRLSAPKQDDAVLMDFEPLTISGSGMSLAAKERFNAEDLLEIRIVLGIYPAKVLYLYGKVTRVEQTPNQSGRYTTGVRFVGMSETVRDEILKFDFKKHRERLIVRRSR